MTIDAQTQTRKSFSTLLKQASLIFLLPLVSVAAESLPWTAFRIEDRSFLNNDINEFTRLHRFRGRSRIEAALLAVDKTAYEQSRKEFLQDHFIETLRQFAWYHVFDLKGVERGDDFFVDDYDEVLEAHYEDALKRYGYPTWSFHTARRRMAEDLKESAYPFEEFASERAVIARWKREELEVIKNKRWMDFAGRHLLLTLTDETNDEFFVFGGALLMRPKSLFEKYKALKEEMDKAQVGLDLSGPKQRHEFLSRGTKFKAFYAPDMTTIETLNVVFSPLKLYQLDSAQLFDKRWAEAQKIMSSLLSEETLALFIKELRKSERFAGLFPLEELKILASKQYKKSDKSRVATNLFFLYQLAIYLKQEEVSSHPTQDSKAAFKRLLKEKREELLSKEFHLDERFDTFTFEEVLNNELRDFFISASKGLTRHNQKLLRYFQHFLKLELEDRLGNLLDQRALKILEIYAERKRGQYFWYGDTYPSELIKGYSLDIYEKGSQELAYSDMGPALYESVFRASDFRPGKLLKIKMRGGQGTHVALYTFSKLQEGKFEDYSSIRLQKDLTQQAFSETIAKTEKYAKERVLREFVVEASPEAHRPLSLEASYGFVLGQL